MGIAVSCCARAEATKGDADEVPVPEKQHLDKDQGAYHSAAATAATGAAQLDAADAIGTVPDKAKPAPADNDSDKKGDWSVTGTSEDTHDPSKEKLLLDQQVCGSPWDLSCSGIPVPPNEQARKDTAVALGLYGAAKCVELDFVLETLCRIFDAPYASIALYYNRACWLSNTCNTAPGRMTWRLAACPWNCLVKQPMTIVCGELLEDARFRHQPWVAGGLRCYCSAPLLASNGHRLGTICFMDTVPRKVDAGMCRVLNNFGEIAVRVLERHLKLVQRLEAVHQAAPEQLSALMQAASKAATSAGLQRCTSQGQVVQGPDAGYWARAASGVLGASSQVLNGQVLGSQRRSGIERRPSPSDNNAEAQGTLSRMNSRHSIVEGDGSVHGGRSGLSPADVLLNAAFSRQLRHPDVLLDACVLIVDTSAPGWTIIYADETFRQWSGFARADILGRRLSEVLRPGAPGVAPLNWDALQEQADAQERFVLSGLIAVNPTHGADGFGYEDSARDMRVRKKEALPGGVQGAAIGVVQEESAEAVQGSTTTAPAAVQCTSGADVAIKSHAADHVAAAASAGAAAAAAAAVAFEGASSGKPRAAPQQQQAPKLGTAPSAEYLLEQVQVLEHNHRSSVEMHLAAAAEAAGVQLGHEAAGDSFLMSSFTRPHSLASGSHVQPTTTAGNSQQFTTSGPMPVTPETPLSTMTASAANNTEASAATQQVSGPAGQSNSGTAAGVGHSATRAFDLSCRPCALDVLDEDALPLGMPSFVPLEACEPVLRLYVVRFHERLSLPPPPQPLTPLLKAAGRHSPLAQLTSYLFPGLKLGQVLGRGGYGTAYQGQWHDVHVVVKVEDHELQDAKALSQAQLEISLGQILRHPNLVRTLGHGAVELPPPQEKQKRERERRSPPKRRTPQTPPTVAVPGQPGTRLSETNAGSHQGAPTGSETSSTDRTTPASAVQGSAAGMGAEAAALPGLAGGLQQEEQQGERDDFTTDSAMFELFGAQLQKWMADAEDRGDYFGDSRWLSHCESTDLLRRELLSRTSTWNVDLPDAQLMINASSIARDATQLASPGAGGPTSTNGYMMNSRVYVAGNVHAPFGMEAIQEEGAISGSIRSAQSLAQRSGSIPLASLAAREGHSGSGAAYLEATPASSAVQQTRDSAGSAKSTTVVSHAVEHTSAESGQSQHTSAGTTTSATISRSSEAAEQQLQQPAAQSDAAEESTAFSYHRPLAGTSALHLSAFKPPADGSLLPPIDSSTGMATSGTSAATSRSSASTAVPGVPLLPSTDAPDATASGVAPQSASAAAATRAVASAPEVGSERVAHTLAAAAPGGALPGAAGTNGTVDVGPAHLDQQQQQQQQQQQGGQTQRFASSGPASSIPAPSTPNHSAPAPRVQSNSGVASSHSTSAAPNSRTGDAAAAMAAMLESGAAHAEKVHAKPLNFPLYLRTLAVMEFCDGGTLQDAIDRGWLRVGHCVITNPPNIPKLVQLALDICQGVEHLHERGVVHADLSANNVLLCRQRPTATPGAAAKLQRSSSNGSACSGPVPPGSPTHQQHGSGPAGGAPGLYTLPIRHYSLAPQQPQTADEMQFVAKVSDLGKAVLLGAEGVVRAGSYATITHTAPEVLKDRHLSPAADMYALGVLMWQMYTGSRPYASLSHAQIMAVVMSGSVALEWPIPSELGVRAEHHPATAKLAELGGRCLNHDPTARPTAAQARESLASLLAELTAVALPADAQQPQQQQEVMPALPINPHPTAGTGTVQFGC